MKKFVSAILTAVILISIIAVAETGAGAKSKYAKYSKVVKNIITSGDDFTEGNAFMCDLDKNGTKELVTFNNLPVDGKKSNSSADKFFSVYTLKNGKLKAIVKNRLYNTYGGACGNGVGVAEKNGKRYLAVYKDYGSGDVSDNYRRTVKITLYKVTATKIKKVKTASMNMVGDNSVSPLRVKKLVTRISGKNVKYSAYKKWLKSFKYSYIKLSYVSYRKYHSFEVKSKTLSEF